jgi:2-methylfumaryl-CoA hydratase
METLVRKKGRSLVVEVADYQARAPEHEVVLDALVTRSYGHYLEDVAPGTVFVHPRGVTLDRGGMQAYARTFMEANPLYLNERFAERHGYESLPAAPHLVMNLALSLGVQNDSEKAIANLGYWDVRFLRPVYAGDTLSGKTRVVARRDRGAEKPGIVTVETLAENQDGRVVMQYRRKIMVPRRGAEPLPEAAEGADPTVSSATPFPWRATPKLHIPFVADAETSGLTSERSTLGAFSPGQIWIHENGRTITDEHMAWTYQVMNTHPLHYDRLYSQSLSGAMSGEPIVYGGLVFAWLLGLASRDVSENAAGELGMHAGFHTQPVVSGDTVYALTRVLEVGPAPQLGDSALGVVRTQLVGVKNLRPQEALDRHGAELFMPEDGKKARGVDKIGDKIFEIERSLLVRANPA